MVVTTCEFYLVMPWLWQAQWWKNKAEGIKDKKEEEGIKAVWMRELWRLVDTGADVVLAS